MYGIEQKNPEIGCMQSELKSSWIEYMESKKKKKNPNMVCIESNKKNLKIGCMELERKF
jgi:hypothetical protein